jgi:hypothetical protein
MAFWMSFPHYDQHFTARSRPENVRVKRVMRAKGASAGLRNRFVPRPGGMSEHFKGRRVSLSVRSKRADDLTGAKSEYGCQVMHVFRFSVMCTG